MFPFMIKIVAPLISSKLKTHAFGNSLYTESVVTCASVRVRPRPHFLTVNKVNHPHLISPEGEIVL